MGWGFLIIPIGFIIYTILSFKFKELNDPRNMKTEKRIYYSLILIGFILFMNIEKPGIEDASFIRKIGISEQYWPVLLYGAVFMIIAITLDVLLISAYPIKKIGGKNFSAEWSTETVVRKQVNMHKTHVKMYQEKIKASLDTVGKLDEIVDLIEMDLEEGKDVYHEDILIEAIELYYNFQNIAPIITVSKYSEQNLLSLKQGLCGDGLKTFDRLIKQHSSFLLTSKEFVGKDKNKLILLVSSCFLGDIIIEVQVSSQVILADEDAFLILSFLDNLENRLMDVAEN
ncbi:hypothetical protein [Sporosalibacterium faouarense]|uniref:hypothetical protein n=1 Tax=Sporosalibacterium faouarense TaxID=516123 RepID=UPI00192BA1EE|nr:hypothetical protein [Sporosalibacterium faouarense]